MRGQWTSLGTAASQQPTTTKGRSPQTASVLHLFDGKKPPMFADGVAVGHAGDVVGNGAG